MNQKLGYYTVGDTAVFSKIEALMLATKTGHYPQWHFNDQVWQTHNWLQEPETDIYELYRMRARQIREQYDYVIVYYSGGSDSQTLVDAFLDSGCFIDEIVTLWGSKKFIADQSRVEAWNIDAEYEFTTRPGLDNIIARSPKTKITYRDYSQSAVDLFDQLEGPEWVMRGREHLNPNYLTRGSFTIESDQLKTLDRGLNTAIVVGIDKPKMCIKDDKYCLYFLDTLVNLNAFGDNRPEYNNYEYVLFYWTPEIPEIVVKQAQMIRRWFEANPALKPLLAWPMLDYSKRSIYEALVRSIVYPHWDQGKFQCVKPSRTLINEWDHWFFENHKSTRAFHHWQQGVDYVQQTIDPKFHRHTPSGEFDGFVGMINGHFAVN